MNPQSPGRRGNLGTLEAFLSVLHTYLGAWRCRGRGLVSDACRTGSPPPPTHTHGSAVPGEGPDPGISTPGHWKTGLQVTLPTDALLAWSRRSLGHQTRGPLRMIPSLTPSPTPLGKNARGRRGKYRHWNAHFIRYTCYNNWHKNPTGPSAVRSRRTLN